MKVPKERTTVAAELDNTHNSMMFIIVGNGLWEIKQMEIGVRMALGLWGLWHRKC